MGVFQAGYGFGVGSTDVAEKPAPSNNHYKTKKLTTEARQKIASMGLVRMAGNAWLCPSSKDIWKVQANGKIVRLSADEVNNGETLGGAPTQVPEDFLGSIMGNLEF
jgi:hypothetical protein